MSDLLDDIIKYRKGELSPKEMHALERRALNDPFLTEALMGSEKISPEDLLQDIADINQKILKEKKAVLFTPLRIAAGVVLVLASIFVFYQFIPKAETLALKTEKKKDLSPLNKMNDSIENPSTDRIKKNETVKGASEEAKKSLPGKRKIEDQSFTISAEPKKENQPTNAVEADSKIEGEELRENVQEIISAPVVAKPVEVQPQRLKEAMKPSAKISEAEQMNGAGLASRSAVNMKSISGKVVSSDDGSPVSGVNVVVDGTTLGTVTKADGSFNIQTSDDNQRLVFSFIGFQTKEVETNGKDKLDVAMSSDVIQLNGVVVTKSDLTSDGDAEPVIRLAYPAGGEKAYDKYLETNLHFPAEAIKNNVKGKVRIEFVVHTDGSVDQFKAIKRLGYGCEEELIRLIKEGAKWIPTIENGKPIESRVRVGLKFDPAKSGR